MEEWHVQIVEEEILGHSSARIADCDVHSWYILATFVHGILLHQESNVSRSRVLECIAEEVHHHPAPSTRVDGVVPVVLPFNIDNRDHPTINRTLLCERAESPIVISGDVGGCVCLSAVESCAG